MDARAPHPERCAQLYLGLAAGRRHGVESWLGARYHRLLGHDLFLFDLVSLAGADGGLLPGLQAWLVSVCGWLFPVYDTGVECGFPPQRDLPRDLARADPHRLHHRRMDAHDAQLHGHHALRGLRADGTRQGPFFGARDVRVRRAQRRAAQRDGLRHRAGRGGGRRAAGGDRLLVPRHRLRPVPGDTEP